MSLIVCPECGKENVSDSAISCPNCGFNIREYYCNQTDIKAKVAEKIRQEEARKSMEAKIAKYHEEQKRIKQEESIQIKDVSEYKYVFMCPKCQEKKIYDVKNPYACMCIKCLCTMVYIGDIDSINSQVNVVMSKNVKSDVNIPKCPTCQSTNIHKIGTGERVMSVATLGFFSKKINKSFKCRNCGYIW